ncbi:unnamed protein product [Cuscuta campestris]|uniref:RING-type domain-containing protein n=1 Tax=Cuscuta campestris TaxID=132261 RepID=A0A484MKV1_9ASTE|nr:unnamed protein product [Cuscuta campestris]
MCYMSLLLRDHKMAMLVTKQGHPSGLKRHDLELPSISELRRWNSQASEEDDPEPNVVRTPQRRSRGRIKKTVNRTTVMNNCKGSFGRDASYFPRFQSDLSFSDELNEEDESDEEYSSECSSRNKQRVYGRYDEFCNKITSRKRQISPTKAHCVSREPARKKIRYEEQKELGIGSNSAAHLRQTRHFTKTKSDDCNRTSKKDEIMMEGLDITSEEEWETSKSPSSPNVRRGIQNTRDAKSLSANRRSSKRAAASFRKYNIDHDFYVGEWDDEDDSDEGLALIAKTSHVNSCGLHPEVITNESDDASDYDTRKKDNSRRRSSSSSSSSSSLPCLRVLKSDKKIDEEKNVRSAMCHQCQRKDRRIVVACSKCKENIYCIRCIKQWYPKLSEEEIAEVCPFCRGNCNCNNCLHSSGFIKTSRRDLTDFQRLQHLQYLVVKLLPFLEQIRSEQVQEILTESVNQGVSSSLIEVKQSTFYSDERVYCNQCSTSILDLHRSCPGCSYELCLRCCEEIRKGKFPGCPVREVFKYKDKGCEYMHGGDPQPETNDDVDNSPWDQNNPPVTKWAVSGDGSITCAPQELGGCGSCILELKRLLPKGWISTLEEKATRALSKCRSLQTTATWETEAVNINPEKMRRAADRVGSKDNCLYCPTGRDVVEEEELFMFRSHWGRGEPVIVRDVLDHTAGLSWEPMVMWRALCENTNPRTSVGSNMSEVKAVDCLAGCEVKFLLNFQAKVLCACMHGIVIAPLHPFL